MAAVSMNELNIRYCFPASSGPATCRVPASTMTPYGTVLINWTPYEDLSPSIPMCSNLSPQPKVRFRP